MGDGDVGGILSVDISDWETPGRVLGQGQDRAGVHAARRSPPRSGTQLKAALNDGDEVLADANLADWFLDPAIVHPNPTRGDEPRAAAGQHAGLVGAPPDRRAARGREPLPRLRLRPDLHRPRDDGGRQRGGPPRRQRDPRRERTPTASAAASGRCGSPAACRSRRPGSATASCSSCSGPGALRRRRSP